MDSSTREVFEAQPGRLLLDYMPEDMSVQDSVVIQYNGHNLTLEQASTVIVRDGDFLEFYRCPHGIGIGTILVYVLISAVLVGIQYAITALTAPSQDASEESFEESATYGFGGLRNTVRPGTRIPIVYGEHRVAGHILQQFLEPGTGSSTSARVGALSTLIGLCSGEIEDVSSVRVDRNDVEILGSDVNVRSRTGQLHQSSIRGFEEVVTQNPVGIQLTKSGGPYEFQFNLPIDAYRVVIRLPQGLLSTGSKGQVLQRSIVLIFEHALVDPVTGVAGSYTQSGTRVISDRTRNAFDAFFKSPELERGEYKVRVTRFSADETLASAVSRTDITSIDGILDEELTYPLTALLGVRQLPTSQVSGRAPTYDCMVKGRKVRIYSDTSTYTVAWSDNPAWCLLDLLGSTHDALGPFIGYDKCDIQSFIDWAAYCDTMVDVGDGTQEKRYRLDMVVDGSLTAIDTVKQICSIGQGMFLLKGNQWAVKIDQPEAPTQKLSMGRIREGTFNVQHDGKLDKANYFIAQFLNRDIDFDSDSLQTEDQTLPSTLEQVDATINMAGATRVTQVQRLLNYHMLTNRLIKRTVEFEASVETLTVVAGDVFLLAHDVPGWGFSGIIETVNDTFTTIKLDRDVTIESGKSYEFTVVHAADDVIDVVLVLDAPTTTDTISVGGTWQTNPAPGDHYSFGEVAKSTVKMRVISISKGSAPWRRTIRAREYDENVYGTDLTVLPMPSRTRLQDPFKIPDPVTNLRLTERQVFAEDGSLSVAIDVHFTLPNVAGARAEVFWRQPGDRIWESVGITNIGLLTIRENVEAPNGTYQISVVTLSLNGTRQDPETGGVWGRITTTGSTRQPADISGFRVDRTSTGLMFSWDALDPVVFFDLARYEVREGTTWESAVLIGQTSNTSLETTVFVKGTRTFLIKAFNRAGNESRTATAIIFTVDSRIGENLVVSQDEHPGWTGDKEHLTVDASKLVLDATSVDVGWRALRMNNNLGTGLRPGGRGTSFSTSGTYTTSKIEVTTGSALRTIFSVDIQYEVVDPSLFWTATGVGDKTWESTFGQENTWSSASPDKVGIKVEMRFSSNTTAEEDFTAWKERPQNVEILAKHVQARVTVTLKDPSLTVRLTTFTILADVPDIVESGTATSSGSSTVSVTFVKAFQETPSLGTTILGAEAQDRIRVTNLDNTGFDFDVVDDTPTLQGGRTVEWIAAGF